MILMLACLAEPPSVPARVAQGALGGEGFLVQPGERVPVGDATLVQDPPGCARLTVTDRYTRYDDPDCRVVALDERSSGAGPDVLLLSIDTLRADHLQYSPALSAFAEEAWTFAHARAPSPWTFPSLVAVLTGRWLQRPLGPEQSIQPPRQGLAETLGAWRPRAVVSNPHLRPNRGIAAGFRHFRVVGGDDAVVEQALGWLAEDGPDLVFAHVMGPHLPYEGFDDLAGGRAGLYDADTLRGHYRETVALRLEMLAPLLEAADVVVVFSDHGEELWEHDGFEHGHALWEEVLEVPLLIGGPGIEPRQDARPARLVDIPPTLATLLGVPAPEAWVGVSLATEDPGVAVAGQLLYESEHRSALVLGGLKLLDTPGGAFLFELPDELTPLAREADRRRLARAADALPASDLHPGPSTAPPTWARAVDLTGVASLEIDGHVVADPVQPPWTCGWMEQVEERLFRMDVDVPGCTLRLGVIGTSVPEIRLVDAQGGLVYEGLVKGAGDAIEPWAEDEEDLRLKALGYRD
ncbi:MAG TPA: sulfatase [Myxococcota bacterium]|nr:sulfatase [Myxococcota bacterium]